MAETGISFDVRACLDIRMAKANLPWLAKMVIVGKRVEMLRYCFVLMVAV
jgi:hypothetical protein